MENLSLFLCTDCPGLIEGVWAGLGPIALGALATLRMAVGAVDREARTRAVLILIAGGTGTLIAARFVGVAVWQMLDPAALG